MPILSLEPKMNESEYYAGEISDAELNAIADAGDYYLEEARYNHMPSKEDLSQLEFDGNVFLLLERRAQGRPRLSIPAVIGTIQLYLKTKQSLNRLGPLPAPFFPPKWKLTVA